MQSKAALLTVVNLEYTKVKIYIGIFEILLVQSTRGKICIFILYEYDSNIILDEIVKARADEEMEISFNRPKEKITERRFKPNHHAFYNEASKSLRKNIKISLYQIAPPGNHRTKNPKRVIRT